MSLPVPPAGRLPDFLIVGVPKAGTSTLAFWVADHPDVFLVPWKEIHYFDRDFHLGEPYYRECFAGAAPTQLAGEATPMYLYSDVGLDRMYAAVPGARLVVALREPVRRAWSHFQMWRSVGHDTRSFRTVVTRPELPGVDYLGLSEYLPRLQALTDRFGRQVLHVLFFEELIADPQGATEAVWRHIGVRGSVQIHTERHLNPTYHVRSPVVASALRRLGAWRWPRNLGVRVMRLNTKKEAERMESDLLELLRDRYRAQNAALAEWLGRPLPESWLY